MNISELQHALNVIADEVTDDSNTRLASVSRRVRVARTSKVVGTIVTTCAAAMALVFLPSWGGLPDSDHPSPAAKPFGNLTTVRDGDLLVYTNAGGVRLLGEKVGAQGARSIRLTVTPRTGNLGWSQLCALPEPGPLQYHLTVNGKGVPSAVLERLRYTGAAKLSRPNSACDKAGQPMQVQRTLSLSPTGNVAAWRSFDVQPGVPATFALSVTSTGDAAGRAALARATLRLGVFEKPRHPVLSHGVWADRHIVDPAAARGAFRLVHRQFVRVQPGRTQLSVAVPHTGEQIYLRTFVVGGEGSGVVLRRGAATPNDLATATGPWRVEKLVAAGTSTVQAAVAIVPAGAQRQVAMLVYSRYP